MTFGTTAVTKRILKDEYNSLFSMINVKLLTIKNKEKEIDISVLLSQYLLTII